VYYAFITATTVGYGDFHPKRTASKYLAIAIALIGLMSTGTVVAVGVHAASHAFKTAYSDDRLLRKRGQLVTAYVVKPAVRRR
jgi:hypothetical protein